MSDKQVVIVVGPESAGTRLATRLLVAHGCWGDAGHAQQLDGAVKERDAALAAGLAGSAARVVFRRSYPHGGQWPDLREIVSLFEAAGFAPLVVVVRRNWPCTALSQVSAGHTPDVAAAMENIRQAENTIARQVKAAQARPVVVDYDFLVSHPRAGIAWLARQCGLEPRLALHETITLFNNDKHVAAIIRGDV
jgi:hypothetical protein